MSLIARAKRLWELSGQAAEDKDITDFLFTPEEAEELARALDEEDLLIPIPLPVPPKPKRMATVVQESPFDVFEADNSEEHEGE